MRFSHRKVEGEPTVSGANVVQQPWSAELVSHEAILTMELTTDEAMKDEDGAQEVH